MSFEMDDVEIGMPVGSVVGGAAEIVSVGQSDGLRQSAIANELTRRGVKVNAPEPSSPAVGAFNACSAGTFGVARAAPSVAPAMSRNLNNG